MKRILTPDGHEKIRGANFKRWYARAISIWGERFSYPDIENQYVAQKRPILIECPLHGVFSTTPDKHLRNGAGGCPDCGKELKRQSKTEVYLNAYRHWLQHNLPAHLEPASPFVSPQRAMDFKCKRHQTVKNIKPVALKNSKGYGCDLCAREATVLGRSLTTEALQEELSDSLPDHLAIVAVEKAGGKGGNVLMKCDFHGSFKSLTTTVRHGTYICPTCAKASMGFTSTRMLRLIEQGIDGRDCWLAVMSVEVFCPSSNGLRQMG